MLRILMLSAVVCIACDPSSPSHGVPASCDEYFNTPALWPRSVSLPTPVVQDVFVADPANPANVCLAERCTGTGATMTCTGCAPVLYLVCDSASAQHGYCPSATDRAVFDGSSDLALCEAAN